MVVRPMIIIIPIVYISPFHQLLYIMRTVIIEIKTYIRIMEIAIFKIIPWVNVDAR